MSAVVDGVKTLVRDKAGVYHKAWKIAGALRVTCDRIVPEPLLEAFGIPDEVEEDRLCEFCWGGR